jgi:hypothetical protein
MFIPEDPFRGLLDDEAATEIDSEKLKTWTDLLRDLANYGSHLIPRTFSTADHRSLGDAIVIGVLLRQIVGMVDAIEILLCRSAVHASTLQLRALFESSLYLEWTLVGDLERKAAYYYVHNLLRLRRWAMRVQPGTPEHENFKRIFDAAGLPLNQTLGDEGKRQTDEIERVLAQPRFADICKDLRQWKKLNRRDPAWYSPLGVSNLREVAAAVQKEPLYVVVYGMGSEVMHASNYGQHVTFNNNRTVSSLFVIQKSSRWSSG